MKARRAMLISLRVVLVGAFFAASIPVQSSPQLVLQSLTEMAAEQGDASAQLNLGNSYYNGQGVPQDYKEAMKWYRKAAEQGDVFAQFNLGIMFYHGQGVPKDYG